MEEQIKGFEAGDLVTNDPAEIDQAQQDAFDPAQVISGTSTLDPRISALAQALAVPDFEKRSQQYRDRLSSVYAPSEPANFYDLATDLGRAILAAPADTGPFSAAGAGFVAFSDRLKAAKEEDKKNRRAVALKAAELAMSDVSKAEDKLRDFVIDSYQDQLAGDVDVVTLQFDEVDEQGQPTGRRVTRSFDKKTQSKQILKALRQQNGVKVSDLPDVQGESTLDKESSKIFVKDWVAISKKGNDAYGRIDNIRKAKEIAGELGPAGFGKGQELTLPFRQILADMAPWATDIEKLRGQEALKSVTIIFTLANVAQTKGAISNKEMTLFEQASPNLGQTYEGFLFTLDIQEAIARKEAEFAREYSDEFNRLMKENPDLKGPGAKAAMDAWTAKWREEGRDKFLTEEQKARIQKAADDAKKMGIGDYTGYQKRRDEFIKEQNERGQLAANAGLDRATNRSGPSLEEQELLKQAEEDPSVSREELAQLYRDIYAKYQ
tara:strand:- start:2242 stop:3720 length:1479 start_codon:yes stop_codon:yes gene_type:complete